MNRREFLRGAAVSAAGAAIGGCVTSETAVGGSPRVVCAAETDVLVVGGGPAGVCAAVAAARGGAKVLIVEQGNCLGGMATQGLVGPFMTCFDAKGEVQLIRGLFDEIVREMVRRGGAIHPRDVRQGNAYTAWIDRGHDHVTPFEPETLKFVLDDLVANAGVDVLYHATFLAPVMDGGRIVGVDVLTKKGVERLCAKVTVDATGDGDVAFRAGVPCELGDAGRGGAMQPATTFFRIGGLPRKVVEDDYAAHGGSMKVRLFSWYVKKAKAAGKWHIPRPHVNLYLGVRDDEWFVNCSRLNGVDATDPKSVSAAETAGRRQVREILDLLRTYLPGGRDIRLLSTSSTLGIRESRHVLGDCRLDAEDVVQGRVPDDSIALCANSIDLHGGKGAAGTLYRTIENGRWYGIPYRCLLPRTVDGLLVAGRCVSASSVAAAAIRVMPPTMAMGEAAGAAAALAVKAGVVPRRIDVQALVTKLRGANVFLG